MRHHCGPAVLVTVVAFCSMACWCGARADYGDYTGDGIADLFVWRATNGQWYWLESQTGFTTLDHEPLGAPGDSPLVGDIDGDDMADPIVWRPDTACRLVLPGVRRCPVGLADAHTRC